MRIRSLEITGFKSFGDRVVLAFDRGISAIVGPNGCGKSNVVDAIRWVMGEQNPRHLRGRAMDDVIFAGTTSKPAVGMAEVVLTLDNSDGRAQPPYDGFSEIQVARRLYRSGESEYLINKTPARLRDVTDFFLDTGVGTRGYTIVEQGKIAEIVSTKPEERRVIFEEAAGIGKYRQRRRETERKLEATQQNLLRVSDILGELRRQIGSLDRQARKAARYKELSAQVRDLELSVSWEELQGNQGRVRAAESELEQARAAVVALEARVARADADLEGERRQHLERERGLQRQSEQLYTLRSEIQSLENRIDFEKRERDGLLRLAEEREEEVRELEAQQLEHGTALQDALRELASVESRLGAQQGDLRQREGALAQQAGQVSELQGRREAVQARLVNLASEAAALESRAETLAERRREFELRLRQSEDALEASAEQAEELGREESALETRLRNALSEQDQLGRNLAEHLRAHQEALVRQAELQRELVLGREKVMQTTGHLEGLRETEKRESLRVAQALAALPEGARQRVRGVLSEVVRVDDGLAPALEAVIGPRLEAVLVEDSRTGLDFLAALRREKAGRATALPLHGADTLVSSGVVPLGRPLLDFVTVDAVHRPLVARLLADVYLVDELEQAVERYGSGEPPAVFVSRSGEVLDRTGALTGGSGAPAGALSRQAEIRRLAEELEVQEEAVGRMELDEAACSGRAAELGRELENLRSRRHTAELAVVNLEKDLERARERGKTVHEAVEEQRAGKEQLVSELERLGGQAESTAARRAALAQERTQAEAQREALAGEIGELQREHDRLEQRLVQARVELAELGGRRDQLRESRDRIQRQVDESRDWIERRREEISRARERGRSLEESAAEAEEAMAGHVRDEEQLRVRQDAERERYEDSSRRVEALEQESRSAAREREGTRDRTQAAELGVQEVRMRRDQLLERIRERYGIDLQSWRPDEDLSGDPAEREAQLSKLRESLQSLGEVHLGALEEYEEVSERFRYLTQQKDDLEESIEKLRRAIQRINRTSRQRFRETFEQVDAQFQRLYPRMFSGGRAHLSLTEAEDVLEAGIEISAQPPGKKLQNVNLLSGGEKALTALALLFAVFTVKPSPFFLLDEVDAALDDANVGRYDELLRELAREGDSQFLIITHNKASIESADKLFGVTMQEPGLSKLVTVELVS